MKCEWTPFAPSAENARRLSSRMFSRLGAAINHICEKSAEHIDIDRSAVQAATRNLKTALYVKAELFAHYHDLLNYVRRSHVSAGYLDDIRATLELIAKGTWTHDDLIINRLSPDDMDGGPYELYCKYLALDPTTPLKLAIPEKQEAGRYAQQIRSALKFLGDVDGGVHGEICATVGEIRLVTHTDDEEAFALNGASAFPLWGALALSCKNEKSIHQIALDLVHEASHLLMYADAIDEPLVLNPVEETFASPLRDTPRPMDGVFHATVVVTRMHKVMHHMRNSGSIDAQFKTKLDKALTKQEKLFKDSIAIVDQSAELTETGKRILDQCKIYMAVPA